MEFENVEVHAVETPVFFVDDHEVIGSVREGQSLGELLSLIEHDYSKDLVDWSEYTGKLIMLYRKEGGTYELHVGASSGLIKSLDEVHLHEN